MTKIKGGADTTKDLQALELEVDDVANEVMENIDFEGEVELVAMVATVATSSS
jgi:hypothetical protein